MNVQQTVSSLSVKQKGKKEQKVGTGTQDHVRSLKSSEQYFFMVVLLDFLFLNACLLGCLLAQVPFDELLQQHPRALLFFVLIANGLAIMVGSFTEIFQGYEDVKLNLKTRDLVISSVIYFGFFGLIYYQLFYEKFEVHFLIYSFFFFLMVALPVHFIARYLSERKVSYLTFAVIGGEASGIKYLENVFAEVYGKRTICVGRFADDEISEVNKLGDYREIKNFLNREGGIRKLFYLDSNLSQGEVRDIIQVCRSQFIDFEVVPQTIGFFDKGVQVDQLSQLPVFRRKREPLSLLKNKIVKRLFDLVFSSLVILLIFPWLYPLIALLIKLESRGPVLFRQMRTGYWNHPFAFYKFRSMKMNKESDRRQAVVGDARITRIGAFLRKTSLDELPQFFNVFLGDMSVVGPRPHMLAHTEEYSCMIDTFMIRHAVKPGITGVAQVSGWRGPTPELYQMAKRVEMDVKYIENWTFWLDCKCIFLTVYNVFKGDKNAF